MSDTLIAALQRHAGMHPGRPAIVCGGRVTSYAQLWDRVLAVRALLARGGLTTGDRVALLPDHSEHYVAACFGAMAAGAIAVPLNTAAKSPDLLSWLQHSQARWLFAPPDHPELARMGQQGGLPETITLDAIDRLPSAGGDPWTPPTLERSACILYTSGTTGAPKGVLLTHANLAANSAAIVRYLELTSEDRIVCVLPLHYSYGCSILHTHLQAGGCVVLEKGLAYPHAVAESLAVHRATGFAGVPSTFALLLGRVPLDKYELSSVRYVMQAGGPMSRRLTSEVRRALPSARLFVMYGQTEATARLTYLPPEDLDRKSGSVGRAIDGVEVEIRSEDGSSRRPCEAGEVWVRGPGIMAGYWQDPEATKAVIRDGWLRTGDEGYLDEDGFLFLSGRRSDIIKTGAHRVSPAEIEQAVEELDEVAEAAAVAVEDEFLGEAIKIVLVAAPGRTIDAQAVKAHCRQRLAPYKIPKHVEIVKSLPRTASGKLRRHELSGRDSAYERVGSGSGVGGTTDLQPPARRHRSGA